ncbi:hypothetical protein VMCG_10115 [Cytospora schulzeri]|uniref:Uncharacterized protein n=1 Tax=Cytospora schulzeri TaxID=448051 RepID=A0A423VG32_9PEZI|nr:hypothetical protein VMCG_10115 [Valsa malicola]
MKKNRRHLSSSDFSDEDRHAHKYSKHAGRAHDKHHLTDNSTSHAQDSLSEPRSRMSHRHGDDIDSESDEILIKHRASQRLPRREKDAFVSRQLRDIEKAQREVPRSGSSTSSQEIHIHYHANPCGSHHGSLPLSSAASTSDGHATRRSKTQGVSANDLTKELKGLTMSWISNREASLSRKRSSRRSKHGHEKRAKHGKQKDAFLAPLEQRWVCYECGKVRSDKIQERHPLTGGQKMQPNWCGQCRVANELKGRPLNYHGQRHYCWGCGIVRSEKYHRENPLPAGEQSEPNYCKPCRESSPGFERNLREASDIGSEVSVRDKAFQRQMHDAELSDIHEDEDGDSIMSNSAPGKENEDPEKAKKIKKATSFLLKNCAFKTKTSSDTSSEGSIPIKILKSMHLEAEKTLSFGGQAGLGGARLSGGSYKPASVESTLSDSSLAHVDYHYASGADTENMAPGQGDVDSEMGNAGTRTDGRTNEQDDTSPTILAFPHQRDTSSPSKQVHWSDNGSRPTTADSDSSAFTRSLRSDTSVTSAGSLRRPRRHPAETTTGSPLEKDSVNKEENIGDSLRRSSMGTEQPRSREYGGDVNGQGLPPSQGTFGETPEFGRNLTGSYTRGQTLSGYGMPPTPPQELYGPYVRGGHVYQHNPSYWDSLRAQSPAQDVPNFSRPYQSPQKSRPDAPNYAYDGSGYGTHPESSEHSTGGFDSAAHFSDKDSRRDFSGNSYFDSTACEFTPYEGGYNPGSFEYMSSHHDGTAPETAREAYMYAPQYASNGGYPAQSGFGPSNFPGTVPPPSSRSFDFSGFGKSQDDKGSNDEFYSHIPKEEDVRNFTRTFMSHAERRMTPPPQPKWHLYDDGDADEHKAERGYEWRGNGQTTIHRPSSGDSAASGNMVTILSIREITDDDDLSTPADVAEDYDAAMRSICAA